MATSEGAKNVDTVTITLSARTIEAALNCLNASASDRQEPERYRSWYAEAAAELQAAQSASVADAGSR